MNQKQHEMTDACAEVHCWSHGIDEAATGWKVCFECGHVYPSARALRRDYRREFWKASGDSWLGRMPLRARLWRVLTVRASRIDFCQHCLHSF